MYVNKLFFTISPRGEGGVTLKPLILPLLKFLKIHQVNAPPPLPIKKNNLKQSLSPHKKRFSYKWWFSITLANCYTTTIANNIPTECWFDNAYVEIYIAQNQLIRKSLILTSWYYPTLVKYWKWKLIL